jgi:hypothetical protein
MKRVYVLTYCKDIGQLYGALLVFDTIRIGFPTAEIIVVDNNSIPEAVIEIEKAARKVNARFIKLENEVFHHEYLRFILNSENDESQIYLIDPDVIFWKNVEAFTTDKLFAGRLIPEFFDAYNAVLTKARIHTSFLHIPSAKLLREKIIPLENKYRTNIIKDTTLKTNDEWVMWDTFAQVFECLHSDIEIFTEEKNECFDHIFCGSHLNVLAKKHHHSRMHEIHHLAIENPQELKGIWREQHEFFLSTMTEGSKSGK